MIAETRIIYERLLKQYADSFRQAGKDGSEENVRRFQVMHDLVLKLLQIKFDKKLATRILDAIAARSLNHHVGYDDIDDSVDDIRALDAIDFCGCTANSGERALTVKGARFSIGASG